MTRPPPPKSGRAPKHEPAESEPAIHPLIQAALEAMTHDALDAAVFVQNQKGLPDMGSKSHYLSRIAADLELAFIERRDKDVTDRLCLDIAATALRILEQGDEREARGG